MSLFQDIPQVLQEDILCKWLRLSDVARLDSALCCTIFRPDFLTMLRTKCVFPFSDTVYEQDVTWFVKRNMKFTKLRLRHKVIWNALERERILECTGSTVRVLELCQDEEYDSDPLAPSELPIDDIYLDIAEYCPQLREFNMWNEKVTPNFNLLLLKCTQLQYLHMEECAGFIVNTLKAICNAPRLARLSLSEAQFVESDEQFDCTSISLLHLFADCLGLSGAGQVRLTACFPNLLGLCLGPMNGAQLLLVAQNCPQVKFANMRLDDVLSDPHAAQLCTLWAHIELLQLRLLNYQRAVCSETAVLSLLQGCRNLLKLSVCAMDDPKNDDFLYYKRYEYNMIKVVDGTTSDARAYGRNASTGVIVNSGAGNSSNSNNGINSGVFTSQVTDLFVDSLSEQHLRAILTLCPRLNTLAIRHHSKITLPHNDAHGTGMTERAAEYVLHLLNASAVRKLHLSHIYSLSYTDLLPLHHLQELQLSHIGTNIDNNTIMTIIKNNPNLSSVSLHHCEGLHCLQLILPILHTYSKLHTLHYTQFRYNHSAKLITEYNTAVLLLYEIVQHSFPQVKHFSVEL